MAHRVGLLWHMTLGILLKKRFVFLVAAVACLTLTGTPILAASDPLRIEVRGIEGLPLDNVRTALEFPAGLIRTGMIDRLWLQRFAHQVPGRVRRALEPYGYYHAVVKTALEATGAGTWRLSVSVDPGPPVRLESVSVTLKGAGRKAAPLLQLIDRFPLRRGDVLRQDLYEDAKSRLKAKAQDLGYLDADYAVHRIRIHQTANRAEIELLLNTGVLYHFGEVRLSGAPQYPPGFLRRFVVSKPGGVFSYHSLGQTQLNFLNSDRFKDVRVVPDKQGARGNRVPVNVLLTPSPTRRLRPGVGYGTDTGARFSLRYQDLNMFKSGQELASDLVLAQRIQTVSTTYTIPDSQRLDSFSALQFGLQQVDVNTYTSRSVTAEASRVRTLGQGRVLTFYLRLLQERYRVGDQSSRSRMILPGVRFSERSWDDPVRPRQGFSYSLEVRGGDPALGSDVGLVQALASGNAIMPLPWRLSLQGRVQGATTYQKNPFAEVPVSLRFFAGGDQSVRGYAYQSLGPHDSSGAVVGGKKLLVGSLELDRAIGKNWGVAVFYDAGNAFNSLSDLVLARGAGIGVRRYTIVGPVKVDLARQLGSGKHVYRVHISVGFQW